MSWWAWEESNLQPTDYESAALTVELQARKDAPNRNKPQTPAANPDLEAKSDSDTPRAIRSEPHENGLNRSEFSQGLGKAQAPLPPDLARVVDTWPDLPEHIRAAVLALVDTNEKRGDR